MAIKFEKIEPGMTLLDVGRSRMGNTTMSEWSMWTVKIISVDRDKRTAIVSWNGNKESLWTERSLRKLYTKPPKAYRDQQERRKKGWL